MGTSRQQSIPCTKMTPSYIFVASPEQSTSAIPFSLRSPLPNLDFQTSTNLMPRLYCPFVYGAISLNVALRCSESAASKLTPPLLRISKPNDSQADRTKGMGISLDTKYSFSCSLIFDGDGEAADSLSISKSPISLRKASDYIL